MADMLSVLEQQRSQIVARQFTTSAALKHCCYGPSELGDDRMSLHEFYRHIGNR